MNGFAQGDPNMTERKPADGAFGEYPGLVQRMIDVLPGLLCIYDLRQNKSNFINRGIVAELGYALPRAHLWNSQSESAATLATLTAMSGRKRAPSACG